MEVLKKGSKGEAVVKLQKALGIKNADGIFGSQTEKIVKEWQKNHSLKADGIVGANTWKTLEITEESKCIDESVVYSPLKVHITEKKNRNIDYLVIHYSGSSNSKQGRAKNTKIVFEKNQASADFCIDDGDMVQFNPDLKNYYCWSVGDKPYGNKGGKFQGKCFNSNSISIEICSTCEPSTKEALNISNFIGWSFTEEALANAKKLAKIIIKKFNISKDHVIRHYDVSGKLCPGIKGWNDEPLKGIDGKQNGESNNSKKWEEFKASLFEE